MNEPNGHQQDDDRLGRLLAALEQGELTDAARNELNDLLRTDEAARETYLDHAGLQALLHARLSEPLELPVADQEPNDVSPKPVAKSACAAKDKTALLTAYQRRFR